MPIIVAENTLSASAAVPSQVSAQLTFDGTASRRITTARARSTPATSSRSRLQATNASSLATGRYAYTMTIVDHGTTLTTITDSGSANVINESSSAFGDGWQLDGLEQIIPETGGVILNLGDDGRSLWFTGSFGSGGGTYTDPQGEFSTLVENSGGSYTRTLTDGTQITFNSGGYQTATIDLNGLHTTYASTARTSSARSRIPYTNVTTFSYSGGYLQTIKDPAGRLTTFTNSGGSLEAVEQADGSFTSYTYDSSGRMTQIKDPLGNLVTISYDSAERVGHDFLAGQHQRIIHQRPGIGLDQQRHVEQSGRGNLARPGDQHVYESEWQHDRPSAPDWWGMGITGVQVDAIGNVVMNDLTSNGLPTVTVDQVNRVTQFTWSSSGNMTEELYPDSNKIQYTYNSDSEPLTYVNADS